MAGIGANLVLLLAFTGLAFFPLEDKPDPTIPDRTTNVRIVVGTDDSGLRDDHGLKGTMPGIHLYDVAGNSIGLLSQALPIPFSSPAAMTFKLPPIKM